jgi:PAS domain S-box-containing protein
MKRLHELIASHEEWLLQRVLFYARERKYVRNVAVLEDAWRLCICTLSAAILTYLRTRESMPRLGPDDDYSQDPIVAFFMLEAQSHRDRGVELGVFLSFLKYYRQVYVDLIRTAGYEREHEEQCRLFVEGFFDHLEIGFFGQWAKIAEGQLVTDQQLNERDKCEHMEEELQASSARFRELFDNVSSGVAIYEAKRGGRDFVIKEFNRAGERIEKTKTEDVTGKSLLEVFPSVKTSGLFEVLHRVWKTGNPERYPPIGHEGQPAAALKQQYVCRLPSGQVMAISEDVSEDQFAQQALAVEKERLAVTLRSIGDGVISTDGAGRVLMLNEVAAGLTGWSQAEAMGKPLEDVFHIINEHSREIVENPVRKVMASGVIVGLANHTVLIARDGTEKAIADSAAPIRDGDGECIGVVLVFRDVSEHQRAEQAIVQSRDFYLTLFDEFPTLIWRSGTDAKCDYFNNTWVRFTGREIHQELDDGWLEGVHPEDSAGYRNTYGEAFQARRSFEAEYRLRRSDGEYRWIISTGRPFSDPDGAFAGYVGSCYDITERRQAEEALRESEARFRSAFEYAAIGMALVGSDGRFLQVNHALCEMLGYGEQDLLATSFQALAHPEDVSRSIDSMERMRSAEVQSSQFEKRYFHKRGHVVWVLVSCSLVRDAREQPLYFISQFQEITQRKRAEQERALLVAAVEQSAESITMIDVDGAIRYVNPAFERISGFKREEVVGRSFLQLMQPHCGETVCNTLWETVSHGEVWSGHITEEARDGALREIETTVSPIRDSSGAVIYYVAAQRDVTHECSMERQLRQAQKMEAIGTLAGGIAHDFNNILAAIIGYTEMLLFKIPKDSPIRHNLEQVLKAGNRAKELVKQILAFSRQSEQEMKPVQISLVVKEALKLLRASLPTTIEIRQNITGKMGMILADPTQIHQVLMNLCTNAAHAMRATGGVLEVGLGEVKLDGQMMEQCPELTPGSYLRLTVRDTGHGMDSMVMARIFDPFFTTKSPGEGTGMGLAVVHGIVKSHGGAIGVSSEPGVGTTFQMFFPRLPNDVVPISKSAVPVPRGSETILFVDDEEALVEMVQQMLEHLGYDVVARTSSREALEAFRAQPHKFDLVITDQTMPQLTGVDLSREVMAIRPDVPVILCTGFSEIISPEKAKAMGIREFVLKPIITREIAVTIRKALEGQ